MNKIDIESIFLCGMVFWFVPFALSISKYPNLDGVMLFCILMFVISMLGSSLFSLELV